MTRSFELYISHALRVGVVKKKKNLIVTTVVKVITDIQVIKQRCKYVMAAMNVQDSFSFTSTKALLH